MIKLCWNSICEPLSIIFNDCLKEEKFLTDWKKSHVVPVGKINIVSKIIDLFPFFQFPAKFLSVSFIMNYPSFLLMISLFLLTSQGLDLTTAVLTNYLLKAMKYISLLMTDLK